MLVKEIQMWCDNGYPRKLKEKESLERKKDECGLKDNTNNKQQ